MRRTSLALLALPLALACTKKVNSTAARQEPPPVVDAGVKAPASASAAPVLAEAPHEARFDPVVVRKMPARNDDKKLRVYDVGDRVIVASAAPVGMAIGDGPLTVDPKLVKGLDDPDSGATYKIESLAGTWPNVFAIWGYMPEARGVTFDLPLMSLGENGWTKVSNANGVMPVKLAPFGRDKALVLAWSTSDDNGVPAGWSGSSPLWQILDAKGTKPAKLKTGVEERIAVRGTQDGHVFILGSRPMGIALTHLRVDGDKIVPVTEHVVPGTESCSSKSLVDAGVSLDLYVAPGGIAVVALSGMVDKCKKVKEGVFQDSEKGLVRLDVKLQNSLLMAVGEAGELWVNSGEPEGLFKVRSGQMEEVKVPNYRDGKCYLTHVDSFASGTWLTTECRLAPKKDEVEVLYRYGTTSQKPIEL